MDNVATTLASTCMIESSSFFHVTRKTKKAWMTLKFSRIRPGTYELAALERLKKSLKTYNVRNVVTIPVPSLLLDLFMPPKELWEAYSNRTVRPSVPLHVRCISPIFFEVGIPNLVCGCILGWGSVAYHFRVTVTLTSDLVFLVIKCPSVRPSVRPYVPLRVRCISSIFFEVDFPNLICGCILGWRSVAYHFWVTVTLTLTSDLVFRIIVSGAYL